MKILEIALKNLNSLKGEWRINLADNAYTSDGIFAITGRTGAGKTTIFDAICLALYGQTPRLGRVGGQSNEIMSRHTNECFAKVIFETYGRQYICVWRQTRAGRTRQLQPAVHTLSEISGRIIADKVNNTRDKVKELTGMDFTRFTQAMMLEQGKFDAFLSADRNDKAEVLELITGTEIYGTISQMVYARSKDENNRLRDQELILNENKKQLQDNTPDSLAAGLEHAASERTKLDAEYTSTKYAQDWLKEIARLESALKSANDDLETHQRRLEEFEPKRKRLDSAERAMTLEASCSLLTQTRRLRQQSSSQCEALTQEISRYESAISHITDVLIPSAKNERSNLIGGITESPSDLMAKIIIQVESYERAMKEIINLRKALADNESAWHKAQSAAKTALAKREEARQKMDDASHDYGSIIEELTQCRAMTTAAVLDEERAKLRPGTPCPLCGSLDHPMTSHTHEQSACSEALFSRTELLSQKAQKCKSAVDSATREFHDAEEKYNASVIAETNARNNCEHLREELRTKDSAREELHGAVSEAIRPLRLANIKNTEDIKNRVTQWAERIKKIDDYIAGKENERQKYLGILEAVQKRSALERENLQRITSELEERERDFALSLRDENFRDENEFIASRMDSTSMEALRRDYHELTERKSLLEAKKSETDRALSEKRAQNITELTRDEIDAQTAQYESALRDLDGKIAVLEQKRIDAAALQAKIDELGRAYGEQKAVAENWASLSGLIGSAGGDKFRVIAQKITLDLVVNNANTYLQNMSGRYILKSRPDSNGLELSVIDKDQAGEIRPTENLSGGERFIVSLALALGLSQISGSKAHVDSLFLDEGFGSLDEDALNTALDALGQVRREGRMIGIISHVSALRERIAAQIQVIPKSEGVSVIEGPGCSRER